MRSKRLSLLAAAPATLLAAGCSFSIFSEPKVWVESTEQFDVSGGSLDRVSLTTHNGAVNVRSAESGDDLVHVTAVKRAGGDDLEEANAKLAAINVARRTEGGTLVIDTECERGPLDSGQWAVRFDVTLPARMAARIESHNGEIHVDGLRGALDVVSHNGRLQIAAPSRQVNAVTHNGAVDYRGPGEEIAIETHNGAIAAALTGGPIRGRLGTHNGAIRIATDGGVRGTLEGETSNGGVSIWTEGRRSQIRRDWFRLEFEDPAAGRLEVSTQNGAIEVR